MNRPMVRSLSLLRQRVSTASRILQSTEPADSRRNQSLPSVSHPSRLQFPACLNVDRAMDELRQAAAQPQKWTRCLDHTLANTAICHARVNNCSKKYALLRHLGSAFRTFSLLLMLLGFHLARQTTSSHSRRHLCLSA